MLPAFYAAYLAKLPAVAASFYLKPVGVDLLCGCPVEQVGVVGSFGGKGEEVEVEGVGQ